MALDLPGPWLWNRIRCAALLVAIVTTGAAAQAEDRLVVHEWGTFTALQDESGDALAGINVDDEPLPAFVHDLASYVLVRPHALAESHRWYQMKGAPQRHPSVTMRLETPVLYFYPPAGRSQPFDVRVDVSIRGGWLTEFYPAADAEAPGLDRRTLRFGDITPQTIGRLAWPRVTVGTNTPGPVTDEHVWTTPRQVQAASLSVPVKLGSEHEKFLFYRGVGHLNVPLRIATNVYDDMLSVRAQCGEALQGRQTAEVAALWLVQARRDGTTAYRTLAPINLSANDDSVLASVARSFRQTDFSAENEQRLRAEMHAALLAAGLFADEAHAMLSTWQRAYFHTAGLRLFFVVPRAWTDFILPLAISRPADVQRAMIGRIELVTPEQRALLRKLSTVAVSDQAWVKQIRPSPAAEKFFAGRSEFGDLGVAIPEDYQAYLSLGRFRNALVLAEQRARPTPELAGFIKAYQLGGYQPQTTATPERASR
jgi:hypothetical protein